MNLDLNTTARKGEKTVEKACPYLANNTYSVIIANLARPIGEFNEKVELEILKHQRTESQLPADGSPEKEPTQEDVRS